MAVSYWDQQANYQNPDYASDAQKASQRAYADALMKRSGEKVERPTGALANMITALTAGLERNRINSIEQMAQGQATKGDADLIQFLQRPQESQAAPLAPVRSPSVGSIAPMGDTTAAAAVPTARAEVMPSNKVWGDKEAETAGLYEPSPVKVASLGPAGGNSAPVGASVPPVALPVSGGTAAPPPPTPPPTQLAAGGDIAAMLSQQLNNPMVPPEQKEKIRQLMFPTVGQDVYGQATLTSPLGGVKALPAGPGVQQGFRAPITAGDVSTTNIIQAPGRGGGMPSSAIPGGTSSNPLSGVQPLIDASRVNSAAKASDVARAGAAGAGEGDIVKGDIEAAASAPNVLKDVGTIKSIIQQSGDKLTFGPTANFSNDAMRVIANYAPGLVDKQALAGADAIEKLNLGLAGALSKQIGSGTQGELFRAIGSVPGMDKSKEGALALIDMIQQQQVKAQKVGELYRQYKGNLDGFAQAKQDYLTKNPTVNPLTGRPVEMDIDAARKGGARSSAPDGPTATNPKTGEKMILRGGQWVPLK